MPSESSAETRTEAVAVFDDAETLEAAVDELMSHGFDHAELSLLASAEAVEQKLGHRFTKVDLVEDDEEAPRRAYISTESRGDAEGALIGGLMYVGALAAAGATVASGGTLGAAIAGAAAMGGAGGLIGATLAKFVDDQHAVTLEEQLDRGGLLLWVRTRDQEHEKKAKDVLSKHSAHDVHLHKLKSPV
jgi:outer membrane lipoprotein SlyB